MYTDSDMYEIYRFLVIQYLGFHEIPEIKKIYYSRIKEKLKLHEIVECDIINGSYTFAGAVHVIKDPEVLICDFYPLN
jgi:hypothetical protein